jgi:putative transposase
MRDWVVLLLHLVTTCVRLVRPGGTRSVVAESLLLKHQLLILNRARQRAPRLRPVDRVIAAICATWIHPSRLLRCSIVLKPSTIMGFHRSLVRHKYRWLFSPMRGGTPGPKGPSPELVAATLEMKSRNPRFGCRRIAQQLAFTFGVDIDKDVVRRILAQHYRPGGSGGPSWLTFLGHSKDSLWSLDLFRCESLFLRTHWVMAAMDQYTRRIVGFAVHAGVLDGRTVCRMLNRIFAAARTFPTALSTDHDPLFEFHRWKANLRILEIAEVKSVPWVPMSHPFIERLIGTVRRELLDHVPFWHADDLERKLRHFRDYYNEVRVHHSLSGITPTARSKTEDRPPLSLAAYRWKRHCRGLYQLPIAA